MKFFLYAILGFVAANLCSSQCIVYSPVLEFSNQTHLGCVDKNGVLHDIGTKWQEEDCYLCSCDEDSISCCYMFPKLQGIPKQCKAVVDKETCTRKIVLKEDPSKKCFNNSG
ncbi:beta-microseminoprotein-like [Polypterus senegalus]